LNLFSKMTGVSTRFCFMYNEFITFCVPKNLVSKAIGENGKNVKKMGEILGRKIKVIPMPLGPQDIRKFMGFIVNPLTFRNLEIKGNEIIITAGIQSKAALIGKNKRRLIELQKVAKEYFNKELRII